MHAFLLFAAAFFASAVEMVEALTIVLAVGLTRGWRSAAWGVAIALAALAVLVAVLGPALTQVPIGALRTLVGGLLLVFGLQWLRKAILRASGLKELHNEFAIYQAKVVALSADSHREDATDWYAFTVAFKGVFLEGLEVAFIVVTFGGTQHNVALAALGAGVALVVVLVAGVIAHAPLTRVPENSLKFGVGVMLTSFGIFWATEGAGAEWPGGDAAILGIIVLLSAVSAALVIVARKNSEMSEVAP